MAITSASIRNAKYENQIDLATPETSFFNKGSSTCETPDTFEKDDDADSGGVIDSDEIADGGGNLYPGQGNVNAMASDRNGTRFKGFTNATKATQR